MSGYFIQAQTENGLHAEAVFSENDVLDWDDIELVDETELEENVLQDDDMIIIESVVLYIDNAYYKNPGTAATPTPQTTEPALAMKEVLFRRGDAMKVSDLELRIYVSVQNLETSDYFYTGNNEIEYLNLEEKDERGYHKVKVFISVRQGFLYSYGGGNSYAMFGMKFPMGLKTVFYGGANRVETHLLYENIGLGSKEELFSHLFMDIGISNYFHWLTPILHKSSHSSLLFGTIPFVGINFIPSMRLETGIGFFGIHPIDNTQTTKQNLDYLGIPSVFEGDLYTLDSRSVLEVRQRLGSTGIFDSYLALNVPFMIGTVLNSEKNTLLSGSMYDSLAVTLEGQKGLFWGIHHAVHFKVGFATNLFSDTLPFIAKTNLRGNFYDKIFTDFIRRGEYSDEVSIGNKAFVGSVEYRLGLFRTGIFGLETFVFYDVGAAANTFDMLAINTRHAIGPGLIFHFFSPVGLMLKTNFAFGGALLNQPDGDSFVFSFAVLSRQ